MILHLSNTSELNVIKIYEDESYRTNYWLRTLSTSQGVKSRCQVLWKAFLNRFLHTVLLFIFHQFFISPIYIARAFFYATLEISKNIFSQSQKIFWLWEKIFFEISKVA